jgi:hypothetical protein
MVLGNSQNIDTNSEAVKKNAENMINNIKNPYVDIYHWVKGEILDTEAVYNALVTRD